MASCPFFMFCAPGLVFGGIEDVASCFHVLRSRTRFRRYRGRPVAFSCFPLLDMFLGVPRASGPFLTFFAPGLFFGRTTSSGPFFMFCDPRLIYDGTEGVGSCFHVLRSLNYFRGYQGRRVPFSRFALPDSFWTVPWASRPVFMFCAR
jgi:hypothetical protein